MNKAQLKAQEVEARKFEAFTSKVKTLTRHAYGRQKVTDAEIRSAYDNGQTADALAAHIASREPVGKAVWPLKWNAVARAEQSARDTVERVMADLAANDWDMKRCAPYPRNLYAADRDKALAKWRLYGQLVRHVRPTGRPSDPVEIVERDDKAIDRFIAMNGEMAAAQYDAFVVKLVGKVGERAVNAKLTGEHVWGDSILTVEMADATVERWRTRQIVNVSKLGLLFNQWPTRKMK